MDFIGSVQTLTVHVFSLNFFYSGGVEAKYSISIHVDGIRPYSQIVSVETCIQTDVLLRNVYAAMMLCRIYIISSDVKGCPVSLLEFIASLSVKLRY